MTKAQVFVQSDIPDSLFADLDARDAAVWLLPSFFEASDPAATASILRLPWAFVLSELSDAPLLKLLEEPEAIDSPLVRRRGIIHIVDTNPSDTTLPPRSLPVFLLSGRSETKAKGLSYITRRLTMIDEIKRRSVRHLVILAGPEFTMPGEVAGLWEDGHPNFLTIVCDAPTAAEEIGDWQSRTGYAALSLIKFSPKSFYESVVLRYISTRDGRLILRLRDARGTFHHLDVSGADDPEHPLLGRYALLSEDTLLPLLPSNLSLDEIEGFFKNPSASWRPFAAGMPWRRNSEADVALKLAMRKLDREGVEANRLYFVTAESGAGATTFIRELAWELAKEGYPTLIAGDVPFAPNGIEVASFISRILELSSNIGIGDNTRLYEAPWLIIFDRMHWDGREGDLVAFSRELERSGRRACIVFVTGPYLSLDVYSSRFDCLDTLTHQVSVEEALELGRHLNKYLRHHGAVRTESDWRNFFARSSVTKTSGVAAFWITLSFWLQRQFDFGETVQSYIYKIFKEKATDFGVRQAVISIAALSTEHQPLPENLLPLSADWPISEKLLDLQKELGALGIIRVREELHRYWALIHDLLGRFLLTALFYDNPAREAEGLSDAKNPEHLRFLILKRIARHPSLALNELRAVANAFATSIFKIDPDHGRALFVPFWREVLLALDEMPRAYRTSSRTFLHHSAISRRRVAKDAGTFQISVDERVALLSRATADIEAALSIAPEEGGEPDLNLNNSLAHAYLDLAEAETLRNASDSYVADLRVKAREAARRAFRLNPDNSFVIETYARQLLSDAERDTEVAADNAVEVLGIAYSSMQRDSSEARRHALSRLADAAYEILLRVVPGGANEKEPRSESEAIVSALMALGSGVPRFEGMELSDYPEPNRGQAADKLAHPLIQGNAQAVKLRYMLTCLDRPYDFSSQLELLESLVGGALITPQMSLELAILLHQRDRHFEAARKFRELRQLWRQKEYFVEVPNRLKWLRLGFNHERRRVEARISMGGEGRYYAKVREFQNEEVVFRAQEFGQDRLRPNSTLQGYISFGHNGPFLRPLTAT